MKLITVIILIVLSLSAKSQTRRIAHKSHSGKASTYSVFGKDNFGLPSSKLDSVLKISDKKVVTYESYKYKNAKAIIDTLKEHYHFTNNTIGLDSLKKLYPGVKFIGFIKTNKTLNSKKIKSNAKAKK